MISKKEKRTRLLLSILGLIVFFGVWEAVVRVGLVSSRILSPPSTVLATFLKNSAAQSRKAQP